MMLTRVAALALVVSTAAGCTLPRAALGHLGEPDGGSTGIDAGTTTRPDTGASLVDAFVTPTSDAWSPPAMDAAMPPPPDAWTPPPDAWSAPDAWSPGPRGCDTIYGSADGYHLCTESASQCVFVATLYFIYSCDDVCGNHGGSCVAAHYNGGTDGCSLGSSNDGCGAIGMYDEACVCTHPP